MSEEKVAETPEQSFENLRKKAETLEAQVEELLPYAVESTIRKVGLDPDAGNGAVLKELMGNTPDLERAQEYVTKFGWDQAQPTEEETPPSNQPTPNEQAALDATRRQSQASAVATSDTPPSIEDQIAETEAAMNAAAAAGDASGRMAAFAKLSLLNSQKLSGQIAESKR